MSVDVLLIGSDTNAGVSNQIVCPDVNVWAAKQNRHCVECGWGNISDG